MKSKAHKLIFNLSIKDLKDLGILKTKKKKRKNNKRLKKYYKGVGFADKPQETRTAPNTQGYAFTNVGSITADTQRLQNELAEKALKAPPPVEPTQSADVMLSNPQYIERPNNKNNDYEVALSYLYNTQKQINNQLNALTSNNPTSIDRNKPIINTSSSSDDDDDDDDDGYNLYDNNDVAGGGGSDTFKSQNNPSVHEITVDKLKNENEPETRTRPALVPSELTNEALDNFSFDTAINELERDTNTALNNIETGAIPDEPTPIKKGTIATPKTPTISPIKTRQQRKNAEAEAFLKSIEETQKKGEMTEKLASYKIRYVEQCSKMGVKPDSDIINAKKSPAVNEAYYKLVRKQEYLEKKNKS